MVFYGILISTGTVFEHLDNVEPKARDESRGTYAQLRSIMMLKYMVFFYLSQPNKSTGA